MHEIARQSDTQRLLHPTKSGKRAHWNELYPESMLDELWMIIRGSGIPGVFFVQRYDGPRRGKIGSAGVRIRSQKLHGHDVFFTFQLETKGPQTRYILELPEQRDAQAVMRVSEHLAWLSEQRDHKGNLSLTARSPTASFAEACSTGWSGSVG